jgi:glutamate-1-semialdehyde 2,1-aminomutase
MIPNSRLQFEKSKAFTQAIEKVIPGGAHTYSKGRDQFPLESPSGIVRGKGARVWDSDGNCLVDWSMGLTSVSLGHAHPSVNRAVAEVLELGVNFQRPAALELEAARAFLDFSGTDMVKFAKHGSVVTTAAVKLARGFTGRAKVAVPREHPFFSFDDWFIGTTAADFGIPEELKQFSLQFSYNDIESLDALFRQHPDEIACVMLEPTKFDAPQDDFLHKVRELCTKNGAVLVLDEMVSGLKFAVPSAAKYFDVEADIYTYGKGISNGFSCTALAGRGDIMRLGGLDLEGTRKLFLLSTTHGAESTGLAAMMETVRLFRNGSIIEANWAAGESLRSRLNAVISRHGLDRSLRIFGYPCMMALETLGPDGKPDMAFRTLFLQEMCAWGILFQGLMILTPSHGAQEVDDTVLAFDRACAVYSQALNQGSVEGFLIGPAVKPVFRRHI